MSEPSSKLKTGKLKSQAAGGINIPKGSGKTVSHICQATTVMVAQHSIRRQATHFLTRSGLKANI